MVFRNLQIQGWLCKVFLGNRKRLYGFDLVAIAWCEKSFLRGLSDAGAYVSLKSDKPGLFFGENEPNTFQGYKHGSQMYPVFNF